VDYAWHLDVLGFQRLDGGTELAPAAESRCGDSEVAQKDDAENKQDELDNADPGTGFQTSGDHVEPDDEGHEKQSGGVGNAGDDFKELGGGDELQSRIEHRVQDSRQYRQPADGLIVVVVGKHVAWSNEAVALAQQPVSLGEKGAGDGNRQNVE